jgi:hypothetical protein
MTNDSASLTAAAPAGGKPSPDVLAVIQHQVFAHGATTAFLVGSVMAIVGSAIIWIFLNVKHQELATDGPEGVHVG